MLAKIIATIVLLFGVFKPEMFSRITESWKFGRRQPTRLSVKMTSVMCIVAICSIWLFL